MAASCTEHKATSSGVSDEPLKSRSMLEYTILGLGWSDMYALECIAVDDHVRHYIHERYEARFTCAEVRLGFTC